VATRDVQTPDGRTLSVHDDGDEGGLPVVVHHGTPSSGVLYGHWIEDAYRHGIRLIGVDRAGYGGSSRDPGRDVAAVAADVAAIADALGLERFATWGISGGGPHALACAALCDERLVAAASLAGVAPYEADGLDWLEGMGAENHEEFGLVLQGEAAVQPYLERVREHLLETTAEQIMAVFGDLLGAADTSVLNGLFAAWMVEASNHGLRAGCDGWLDDDLAFVRPWGFELARIDVPVLVVQGGDDRFVPAAHGAWLAAHVPGAEAWLDEADGHLTLIERRVPEVHAWLRDRF
jgi:pimeloyl-ACP methyl ester carboxylesterase